MIHTERLGPNTTSAAGSQPQHPLQVAFAASDILSHTHFMLPLLIEVDSIPNI